MTRQQPSFCQRRHLSCPLAGLLLLLLLILQEAQGFAPVRTIPRTPSRAKILPTPSSSSTLPTTTTSTQLPTVTAATSAAGFTVAAITGAITGGLFAGGLHAIAGPDHLAALLPRCCGQRWYRAGRVGALWGMGHGISATLLGVSAFAVKRTVGSQLRPGMKTLLSSMSHITEIAVGFSLIVIGVMGIKEARHWKEEMVPPAKSLSSAAADTTMLPTAQKRAVVFNGLLHGFSWDGAPSLAPAIAVATWTGNLAFLSAYAIGTVTAMTIVTTLIGEGTRRAGEIFNRPDIPQKLSMASSVLAIAIGAVWCAMGLL